MIETVATKLAEIQVIAHRQVTFCSITNILDKSGSQTQTKANNRQIITWHITKE